MFHWLHHLINPHCPDCQLDKEGDKVCNSCETLKIQLAIANREKEQMLSSILSFTKPAEVNHAPSQVDPKELKPRMMTWNVRKQMLEAEDRKAAQLIADQVKADREAAISKLEEEVGIKEEVSNNA
jgi:uncharacterized Zn finger protein (UPF0148 family)